MDKQIAVMNNSDASPLLQVDMMAKMIELSKMMATSKTLPEIFHIVQAIAFV